MRRLAVLVVPLLVPFGVLGAPALARGTQPPLRSFTLAATGDLLPEAAVRSAAARAGRASRRRFDFRALLAPVAGLVRQADLAICHVEIPIGRVGARSGNFGVTSTGRHRLLAPHELAADVASTGYDRCSTASNHSDDLGQEGVNSTLDALDAAGLGHHGTASDAAGAAAGLITVKGVTVAHLSYTNVWNEQPPADTWRVNGGDVDRVVADVRTAREAGAEVIVLSVHMGVELASNPSTEQRDWVNALTRQVHVDLIVMHHPHTVEPVEQVNGTWVAWSVGNLFSGMGPGHAGYRSPSTLDGLLLEVTFTEDPARPGSFTATVVPVAVCNIQSTRVVYPARLTLARPHISRTLRSQLTACLKRTRKIVPNAA